MQSTTSDPAHPGPTNRTHLGPGNPERPGPGPGLAALALKRLQWRLQREANLRLATVGLSYPQWDALRHLTKRPDASLHALAELSLQTDQSMGALAKRMIERGLIERMDGAGRAVRHRVTEAGQRLRDAGGEIMSEVLADTLGRLSEEELATLEQLLEKAGAGLDAPDVKLRP
jgi:DNA-binding MarR family transcriptional regulator